MRNDRYQTKLLCYLLSHVISRVDLSARVSLLKILKGVAHPAKLTTLRPLIQELRLQLDRSVEVPVMHEGIRAEYLTLLLGAYDIGAAEDDDAWADFIWILQYSFRSGMPAFRTNIAGPHLSGIQLSLLPYWTLFSGKFERFSII